MLVFVPVVVLSLGAILFRSDPATIPLGVVNDDEGIELPFAGTLNLGDRIVASLSGSETFELSTLERDEIEARLRDGSVQAILVLPSDFTARFQEERQAELDVRLEGSNPSRSQMIKGRLTESAMKALAGLAQAGMAPEGQDSPSAPELPVSISDSYLFTNESFDTMDFIAPVYIAFLAIFFVFILTCISFLRERSQGTMERLLATPATRLEIVLGYMLGLGTFALVQVSVILFFTIWALKIHYLGSLGLVFLVISLTALAGVSMGLLASAFARNEFQVMQFIPLLMFPQILLAGTFWAVEDMPVFLRPFSYAMPLTYANWALRDIMLKGYGLGDIWPDLLVMVILILILTTLGVTTMRREVV